MRGMADNLTPRHAGQCLIDQRLRPGEIVPRLGFPFGDALANQLTGGV